MSEIAEIRRRWGARLDEVIAPVDESTLAEIAGASATVRERIGEPEWSELGAPANDSARIAVEWLESSVWSQRRAIPRPTTFEGLITGPIADVERRRDRDEAIAEATGFKLSAGLRRRPWTDLVPPDVCTMRLMASEGLHQIIVRELVAAISSPAGSSQAALCSIKLGEERWLMESVPYHLPGGIGAELLTSDPPDAELLERIRLPFQSVLVFFEQIGLSAMASAQLEDTLHLDSPTAIADPKSRSIVGVLLAADADGQLEPWVQWLIAEHVIDRGWSVGVEVGLWQRSVYTGAVANLAAICTWGDWRPPPPAPAQMNGVTEGTRDWRRSLQRSASRRAVQRGALTGVRVLDVSATPALVDDGPSASTGGARQISMHWRKGHWQNYRLATRDANGAIVGSTRGERDVDWFYDPRWVRPTLVAAGRHDEPPLTVYQLHPSDPAPGPNNGL